MARTTKAPQARKREFADTAERLFNTKGYENASVDDIVERMGVAKGLFYYYFDSKEEVLDLIIERMIGQNAAAVEEAASRPDLDTMGKFRLLMGLGAALRARSQQMTLFFHKESNRHLHADIEARAVRLMAPALTKIIREGVAEGLFDTKYPEETALALFAASSILGHEVYRRPDEAFFRRRLEASLYILEKLLGASHGTFDFYREQVPKGPQLKRWLRQIKEVGLGKGERPGGNGNGGKYDGRGGRKKGRGGKRGGD